MTNGFRLRECIESTLPTRLLKCFEVLPAVGKWIEWITATVKPDSISRVTRTAFKERLVDSTCGDASSSQPSTNEVNDTFDLLEVLPRIGNTQDTSARLPTDNDSIAVDERHCEDRVHGSSHVAQGTIRPGNRQRRIAAVAERAVNFEPLVVHALRARPTTSSGHHHGPPALH